jgi:hypothetical protein
MSLPENKLSSNYGELHRTNKFSQTFFCKSSKVTGSVEQFWLLFVWDFDWTIYITEFQPNKKYSAFQTAL